MPDFSRFHDAFRADQTRLTAILERLTILAMMNNNCDYLELDGSLKEPMDSAFRRSCQPRFIIPYPPGFPILVPGQVVSHEILAFMRALDVSEIHGYRADLGLRVFTQDALETGVSTKRVSQKLS